MPRLYIHEAPVPDTRSLKTLRAAARECEACPLYRNATQTVFGEGPRDARIVFVGEQPGDQEDLAGKPFVGPAGKLLDRALEEAGINRDECYVTNAVKHFKWQAKGKRRLHGKPNSAEIRACAPWWKAELRIIHPQFLACLGATASRAIFGRPVKVLKERGRLQETEWCPRTLITVHPSALLRMPDEAARHAAFSQFVADLAELHG
jgi:uracil-DNA glycosylase family protein